MIKLFLKEIWLSIAVLSLLVSLLAVHLKNQDRETRYSVCLMDYNAYIVSPDQRMFFASYVRACSECKAKTQTEMETGIEPCSYGMDFMDPSRLKEDEAI